MLVRRTFVVEKIICFVLIIGNYTVYVKREKTFLLNHM